MPELHVIAAGSLLDFAIDSISIPVGRIDFLYMHPLSFLEFLKALNQESLINEILTHEPSHPLIEPVDAKLQHYLGEYIAVGGMPEAVKNWVEKQDIFQCSAIHHQLANAYKQDFQKYSKKFQLKYVDLLFEQIPRYLSKPIKFHQLSSDYRKRELAPCLSLLEKANIICKVIHTAGNGIPLGAESDLEKFKIIFLDIAISQAILGADLREWLLKPSQKFINKGDIAEAFV
jgi:predicted AAA+ superfamily ATPase